MQKIRRKKKRMTDNVLRRAVIFTIVFIIFVLVFGSVAVLFMLYDQSTDKTGEKSFVSSPVKDYSRNVLLLGQGNEPDQTALILMRLDFDNGKVPVTALPAELSVSTENKSGTLSEHIKYGGAIQAKKAVEKLLNISIEHTAVIKLGSFESIIDRMGGVTYYVPERLTFDNSDGSVGSVLEMGNQKLTGAMMVKLMQYTQWPEGKIRQLKIQESLAAAMVNQYMNKDFLQQNAPAIFKFASNTLSTDFSMTDFINVTPAFLILAQKDSPAIEAPVSGAYSTAGDSFSITNDSLNALKSMYASSKQEKTD